LTSSSRRFKFGNCFQASGMEVSGNGLDSLESSPPPAVGAGQLHARTAPAIRYTS
jgi:hypothetical protein